MDVNSLNKNYEYLIKKFQMSKADMNRKIREYSHGMKQKVCLMASLIHNPKIWILDEPTVGLDPKQIIEIRELIKKLGEQMIIDNAKYKVKEPLIREWLNADYN